jgi:hypothetical protein
VPLLLRVTAPSDQRRPAMVGSHEAATMSGPAALVYCSHQMSWRIQVESLPAVDARPGDASVSAGELALCNAMSQARAPSTSCDRSVAGIFASASSAPQVGRHGISEGHDPHR